MNNWCDCGQYRKSIKRLDDCIELSMIHGLGYDGAFFKYCPWCGKELYDKDCQDDCEVCNLDNPTCDKCIGA